MKKCIGLFFLICLFLPATGTYVWLQYHKQAVRNEVKKNFIAGLDTEKLIVLKFSKKDIQKKVRWEHSKEFEFEGEMYDVFSTKSSRDSISYWCWPDTKETQLNKELEEFFASIFEEDPEEQEKHKKLTYFYKSLFFMGNHPWEFEKMCVKKKAFSAYSNTYTSRRYPPPFLPPVLS